MNIIIKDGIEPPLIESKSIVLPLHHLIYINNNNYNNYNLDRRFLYDHHV